MKTTPSGLAICFLIVTVALYMLAFKPMSDALRKAERNRTEETARLTAMKSAIDHRNALDKRLAELKAVTELNRATLLTPMLNSYAMRTKGQIDVLAREAGLGSVEYNEGGMRALPVPKTRMPTFRTARMSVRVGARADYAALASFLLRAEKELPLMTLQALAITQGDRTTPDLQGIEMLLEWPCKGEVIK